MAKKKKKQKKIRSKNIQKELLFEIYGITIFALSLITIASFGAIGRNLFYLSRFILGSWDFLIPLFGIGFSFFVMAKRRWPSGWSPQLTGITLILLAALTYLHVGMFQHVTIQQSQEIVDQTWNMLLMDRTASVPQELGGGMVGALIYSVFHYLFEDVGTVIILGAVILSGILLMTGFSYVNFVRQLRKLWYKKRTDWKQALADYIMSYYQKRRQQQPQVASQTVQPNQPPKRTEKKPIVIHDFEDQLLHTKTKEQLSLPIQESKKEPPHDAKKVEPEPDVEFAEKKVTNYQIPPLTLLEEMKKSTKQDKQNVSEKSAKLEATLASFGVHVNVTEASRGPAVTRYEVQPEVGVKVSRIVNLADDLALALAAKDIRIEAPIPGKSAIGIEVPNPEVAVVGLRNVLESSDYQDAEAKLSIALGRDISGAPIIANLASMPHLLVAGATGAGKSVCINGLIVSLLYKARPDEVKLMMIDPKMVELNIYNGIPHLLTPVVTDPRKAAIALKKVVKEMEKRYELFAKAGARDMERYNQLAQEKPETERLPYIVVIVDELADLMMVAPADVEDAICRLAQMARAAGIHLIIATQRPSVDVITGVIKANIPSRIAFAVSSSADSRTILDMGGAEKLLGRGDMLYLPIGASKPLRVQGTFVTDEEVEAIVNFVKTQQEAEYNKEMEPTVNETQQVEEITDELYPQAVQLVVEAQAASVSLIQRRLRVGYTRAARLMDMMEANGVVGPYEGSKPREVLISQEGYDQNSGIAK